MSEVSAVRECREYQECREEVSAVRGIEGDFKPPKQRNINQWKKVQKLWEHGYTFHSCGCCGPGFRPSELKDVDAFIYENATKSEGELLLNKIKERLASKGITDQNGI